MYRKLAIGLCALALIAVPLAACGDDEEDSADSGAATPTETTGAGAGGGGGGDGGVIAVAADPGGDLAYTSTELSAEAGPNTIEFENESSTPHDVVVEDDGDELAATETISESEATATAELEPGSYTFYCSVPGHREAGMEGTLEVE